MTQLLEVTFLSFLEGKTLCCWGLRYSHGTRSLLRWTETRNRVQTLKPGKGFKPDFVGVKPEPKYLLLKSSLNQFLEGLFVGVSAIGMEHVPFCGGQKPGVGSKPNFLWFETGSRNSLKKINFGSFWEGRLCVGVSAILNGQIPFYGGQNSKQGPKPDLVGVKTGSKNSLIKSSLNQFLGRKSFGQGFGCPHGTRFVLRWTETQNRVQTLILQRSNLGPKTYVFKYLGRENYSYYLMGFCYPCDTPSLHKRPECQKWVQNFRGQNWAHKTIHKVWSWSVSIFLRFLIPRWDIFSF